MWWTNIAAFNVGVSLLYVITILLNGMCQTLYMIVGVVAYLMTFIQNPFEELWILTHIIAYTEEGSFNTFIAQDVEDKWRSLGDGTVVERQIDCVFVTVHSPQSIRIKPSEVYRWLFYEHVVM
jgi:hypothetical protein